MSAPTTPPYRLKTLILSGLLTTAIGFGGFLVWATLAPLESAVIAAGSLKVGSERKRIQHLEGGLIERVAVREGQAVKAGDLLLTLDRTFAESQHGVLSEQLAALEIRDAVLSAEQAEAKAVSFPASVRNTPHAGSQERMREALVQFQLKRDTLDSRLAILQRQIKQLQEQIGGVRQEITARQQQLAYTEDEVQSLESLVTRKMAGKGRFLELQRDAAELRGILAQLNTQILSLQGRQSELELEQLQARQEYRYAAADELRLVRDEAQGLRQRMTATTNVLERIEVRAPEDGRIVNLGIFSPGEVIQPGQLLMEIVPEQDELIISARVRPVDVDKVTAEQSARVRLSAYKQHEMPELQGRVESISADALYDEARQESYFEARIIMPLMADASHAIKPGMPAEVYILTGSSTPMEYLTEPLLNAFDRAWRED